MQVRSILLLAACVLYTYTVTHLIRPAQSTGLTIRLLVSLTPSTGLLGGRTFLLVLK